MYILLCNMLDTVFIILSQFEVMGYKNKAIEINFQLDFNQTFNRLRQDAMKELKNGCKPYHRKDFRPKQAFKIYQKNIFRQLL